MIDDIEDDKPEKKAAPVDDGKEKVDEDLPKNALREVKKIVRGNGTKPDAVTLKSFEGEVLYFEAYETFKIEPSVAEKRVNGREGGDSAGSPIDAQQKINAAIERISRDREVKKLVINMLKKRPDMGFGKDGLVMRLDRLNKKFVIHEQCLPCESTGKILCQNCHGHKYITCVRCHGEREVRCHQCNGTQFINTAQGQQRCNVCHGQGMLGCDYCKRRGEVNCPKCQAQGKMPCQQCGMTGWHSHVYVMTVKAKSEFDFDREGLPEELPPLIDEYRDRLVTEAHAQARFLENTAKDQELDNATKGNEFAIPYEVRLPWGDLLFGISKNEHEAKLFGFKPVLLEKEPLVEKLAARGIKDLERGAIGVGNVAKSVADATRFRVVAETFLFALPNAPARAKLLLKQKYPSGLSEEAMMQMIENANKAARNLTKKSRMVGLGIGAAFTTVISYIYFMAGFRAALLQAVAGLPEPALDIGITLALGTLMCVTIQLMAGKQLKQALGRVLKHSEKNVRLLPKFAEVAFWGYPAAAAIAAAVIGLTLATNQNVPGWIAALLLG